MDLRNTRTGAARSALFAFLAWATLAVHAAAPSEWVDQRQVGPITVRAQFELAPYEAVLAELPTLELEVRRVLAISPCSKPVTVLLAADGAGHRQLLAARFPGLPARRALYVQQGREALVFAYLQPELGVDLRHECTHALVHASLPTLPLWLDEGLAEYFEPPEGARAFGHEHAAPLRLDLAEGRFIPLEWLEQKQRLEEMQLEDYRFAWAWTHFLLHGPIEASEEFWRVVASVRQQGTCPLLAPRLAARIDDLPQKFRDHFAGWPPHSAAVPATQSR